MGHEVDLMAQLVGDLALMDVVCQSVGNQVVLQMVHVVVGRRFGASARVTRNTKDRRCASQVCQQWIDRKLRAGSITTGVGDTSSSRDLGTVELYKQVSGKQVLDTVDKYVNISSLDRHTLFYLEDHRSKNQ